MSESSEIQSFFRPKSGGLQKKKKKKNVFIEIEIDFSAEIRNSNVFSAQNQVVSKKEKKRFSPKLRLIFRPNSEIQTLEGGCFPMAVFLYETQSHIIFAIRGITWFAPCWVSHGLLSYLKGHSSRSFFEAENSGLTLTEE